MDTGMELQHHFGDARHYLDAEAMTVPAIRRAIAPIPSAWIARAARECALPVVGHDDPCRARAMAIEAFTAALDLAIRDERALDRAQEARRAGV